MTFTRQVIALAVLTLVSIAPATAQEVRCTARPTDVCEAIKVLVARVDRLSKQVEEIKAQNHGLHKLIDELPRRRYETADLTGGGATHPRALPAINLMCNDHCNDAAEKACPLLFGQEAFLAHFSTGNIASGKMLLRVTCEIHRRKP